MVCIVSNCHSLCPTISFRDMEHYGDGLIHNEFFTGNFANLLQYLTEQLS